MRPLCPGGKVVIARWGCPIRGAGRGAGQSWGLHGRRVARKPRLCPPAEGPAASAVSCAWCLGLLISKAGGRHPAPGGSARTSEIIRTGPPGAVGAQWCYCISHTAPRFLTPVSANGTITPNAAAPNDSHRLLPVAARRVVRLRGFSRGSRGLDRGGDAPLPGVSLT